MQPFLTALDERALVCDGAMGTMLYAKGIFLNRSFDELNLKQPDLVAEVHQEYVRAGADVIETNTFGANRVKLGTFGLADELHAINVRGARIARHAAREQAWVAGSIGPLGIRIEPWGKTGVDEAERYFREQAAALLDGGVDLFILETFRDANELGAALRAVRGLCPLPVVAQITTDESGNSLDGTPPETFAPALVALGADVIGLNCSVGPAAMLETIERMSGMVTVRLSAQPNAGRPRDIEGRNIYLCSPEYMASYARRFLLSGVKLLGGCCGTTPDHIRAIKASVRASATQPGRALQTMTPSRTGAVPAEKSATVLAAGSVAAGSPAPSVPREQKSRMANAVARGHWLVAVELAPPRGDNVEELVRQARALKIRGVDLISLPDDPSSGARLSALAAAVVIEQQAGLETLLQFACRDRNLLGMQSDLLGAHALGVRNVLLTTGEARRVGGYPDATGVFDVDSIGLTNVVTRLNRALDVGGASIGRPTAFHVGVAVRPGAVNLDEEIRRFEYKVEAGAEFAVTSPVFDVAALETFMKRIEHARLPLIVTLVPFENARHAEFLANEVPGVWVPDRLVARMRQAESEGRAAAEGLVIARELTAVLREISQGVHVRATAGQLEAALAVMEVTV